LQARFCNRKQNHDSQHELPYFFDSRFVDWSVDGSDNYEGSDQSSDQGSDQSSDQGSDQDSDQGSDQGSDQDSDQSSDKETDKGSEQSSHTGTKYNETHHQLETDLIDAGTNCL
jgi:hypothetical protein